MNDANTTRNQTPALPFLSPSYCNETGFHMLRYLLVRSVAFLGLTSLSTAVLALPYLA
jgi:hypothetical protein